LEEPVTEQILRFDTLQSLVAFLLTQIGQSTVGGNWDREQPPQQP
jgi:hypothetical protein